MATKDNFEISKLSFILDGAHCTHTINDEAIRFRRLLESLLAAPWKATNLENFYA